MGDAVIGGVILISKLEAGEGVGILDRGNSTFKDTKMCNSIMCAENHK